MKKVYLKEERFNQAGTDFPYFYDPKTDTVYEGSWNTMYAYPFGYWPDGSGRDIFCVGDAYETHSNACGKAAKIYFFDILRENLEDAYNLETRLCDFVEELKQYGYTYNEESGTYVSADGSDEFDLDDKVNDISEGVYSIDYGYIRDCVEKCIENLTYPSEEEIVDEVIGQYEDYDFSYREGIDAALNVIGSSFNDYFELGRNEGRIWPEERIISFYETEQPDPNTLRSILYDLSSYLSENEGINASYYDLLGFTIIFEDGNNDWTVTACTVSDYMDGNYGLDSDDEDEDDEDEDEEERQYARDGKTQFVPHLASPEEKREFFKGFRDTRDQSVYVPREKGAGSLARYHALRYLYGENKDRIGKIIREEINKIL